MNFVLPEKLKRLASRRQWVVHLNKVPFSPRVPYEAAKSNDPETWGTLQEAQEALNNGNFDGLGFEFGVSGAEKLRVSGIDLDHVVREDGTLEPFASEIVNLMKSYTEYSPSGKGIHILCETVLEDIGRRRVIKGQRREFEKREGINVPCVIEMYNNRRYFTVTGKIYGEALPVAERTIEFREVYEKYFVGSARSDFSQLTKNFFEKDHQGARSERINILDISDQELLRRMFKSRRGYEIQKLFSGDWSSYRSQSEADLALVSHLLFWTQQDEDRVDSLFRQSGLMRPKWDREDYRERTIEVALSNSVSVYSPRYYFEDNGNQKVINLNLRSEVRNKLLLTDTGSQTVSSYILNGLERDKVEFGKYRTRKTGFENLDKVMNLYPGLYVLGAISSLGKITFACQLADQLTKGGEHVLFFSLEQSRFELVTKGLSRLTAIKNMKTALTSMQIREGRTTPELEEAEKEYAGFAENETIYECGFETTIETILSSVKEYMASKEGVKPVVIVDYLQIVRPMDSSQNTKDAVDSNVRAFKKLQIEKDLVVLLISSLNRSNYLTPVDFESFKESGGIEYTADVIWGLQLSIMNDEMFEKEKSLTTKREKVVEAKKAKPREVELVCLKNRYGISSYKCKFDYYAQYDYFIPKKGVRSQTEKEEQRQIVIF